MTNWFKAIDFVVGCLNIDRDPKINYQLRKDMISGNLDWPTIIHIVDSQRMTPALWFGLISRQLAEYLPPKVYEYLWKTYLLNAQRNNRFKRQAIEIIKQLNGFGIKPMLLKGGASLFTETYGDPGIRVMRDLDILVPRNEAEICWDSLSALGYMPVERNFDYSNYHHLHPLFRHGDFGPIEIHREVMSGVAASIMTSETLWTHCELIEDSGALMFVPEPKLRILHSFLHSALTNRNYARGELSLQSLYEITLLANLYNECIDWKEIQRLTDIKNKSGVLSFWIYCANQFFGCALPDAFQVTFSMKIDLARTRGLGRWFWAQEIMERLMWFSASDICDRYKCGCGFFSLTSGRIRLATHLFCKYTLKLFNLKIFYKK